MVLTSVYSCIPFGISNVSGCSLLLACECDLFISFSSWGEFGFRRVMCYSSVGWSSLMYEFYFVLGSQLSYHQALCFIICCVIDCNYPTCSLLYTTGTAQFKITVLHSSG